MSDIKATFILPSGEQVTLDVYDGWSLMEAARQEGVEGIVAECGGGAICGTCHVRVRAPWADKLDAPGPTEQALLGVVPEPCETSRLSCQVIAVAELDGIEVEVPSQQLDL
ncbi:2Fe-2S iron-sulfur cluster-binding protein [Mycobacterium sp. NPDC004974]